MPSPTRDLTAPLVAGLLLLALVLVLWQANRPGPGSSVDGTPGPQSTVPPRPSSAPLPTRHPEPLPSPPAALHCTPVKTSQPLRVMTFNIHRAHRGLRSDLPGIAAEIRRVDPDVVLLQEVERHGRWSRDTDQSAWLGEKLGMRQVFGVNVVRRGEPSFGYGTAILSRYPVVTWSNRMLPRPGRTEQRGLLRVEIDVAGQRVAVFGTHLDYSRGSIRARQMKRIRTWMKDETMPSLLGGDLNSYPAMPALRIARTFLADAWVAGTGAGPTVPGEAPRNRIDYILHSTDIHATQAGTMPSAVSDHRSVWADLVVPVTQPDCTLVTTPPPGSGLRPR